MAVACVLLAWSTGSARAAGTLDGIPTAAPPVTAQAPTPAATTQQATTALLRAGEPIRSVARPAVAPAREVTRPAAAPIPTVPRPGSAVSTTPVVQNGVDAVSTAPVLNGGADASTQPDGAAADETGRASRKAAPGHARATAASLAAHRDADRREQRVAGLSVQIPATSGLAQLIQLAADRTQPVTAGGWRNRTAAAGAHRPEGQPGTAPVSGSGGATSVAAGSSAAASAAGLLGLLLLLTFAVQRLGGLIRLRPDWAPLTPFLALPERPG